MRQDNQHWGIHLVIALEPTLLHCIAWLVSELLNTPVNQPSHSRVCDWSGLCKYNVLLRWLDTVFQGQYLPSLSINYVAINKVLEKLSPQLYQIKMKICYDFNLQRFCLLLTRIENRVELIVACRFSVLDSCKTHQTRTAFVYS